ncbi:MAG: amino acid adenylation domain-containing protein [Saprospirales bacterium]|nr:MAG: amino acid adenylation domain-containing protein [Saprospirales bacterium]
MKKNFSRLEEILQFSVEQWPNNIAVVDRENLLTYSDLNFLSNQICSQLNQLNLPKSSRIGILLPKCSWSLISIFGILKAGHAYVPLDYDAPWERNHFIIKDCSLNAIIGYKDSEIDRENSYQNPIQISESNVVIFSRRAFDLNQQQDIGEMAYILYTSGSTGKPKGVVFSHSNALSFIHWCRATFTATDQSIFSSHAPFHFDLSILDIYLPLSHGSRLVLIDSHTGKNPRALSHLIESEKITHWYSTPTILKLILHYGKPERFDHSSLQNVLYAGEVFPTLPLRALSKIWGKAIFFNLYGPTETNVCTYYPIPQIISDEKNEPFPIGRVCNHLEAKLIKCENTKQELCISGPAVCQGYWNNEEKNRETFFWEDGKKWYKTGDLVSMDNEGNFIFEGRKDRMIKKNGFRIELGEIENTLNHHPSVNHAAVLAVKNKSEEVSIHSFIQNKENTSLNSADIRNYCNEFLPYYMLPDKIHFVEKLPVTSTDKTDYQALKKMLANGL